MPLNDFHVNERTNSQLNELMQEVSIIKFEIKKLQEGQKTFFEEFKMTIFGTPGLRRKMRHRSQVQSSSLFSELQTKRSHSHRERFAEFFAGMKSNDCLSERHQHKTEQKKRSHVELPLWKATESEQIKVRPTFSTADHLTLKGKGFKKKQSYTKPKRLIPLAKSDDAESESITINFKDAAPELKVPIVRHSNKHSRSFSERLAAVQPKTVHIKSNTVQSALPKVQPLTDQSSSDEESNEKLLIPSDYYQTLCHQPNDHLECLVEDEEDEEELSFQQQLRVHKTEKWHKKFSPYSNITDLSGWKRQRQYLYFIFHDENHSKVALFVLVFIMGLIIISTLFYIVETVPSFAGYTKVWSTAELVVTILFTIEYLLRLISVKNRCAYIIKPINIVDLLAVLPFFIEWLWPGLPTTSLRVIRIVRLARLARLRNLFSEYIEIIIGSIYGAAEEAGPMMSLMILVEVVLFGCSVYAFEKDNNKDGDFESIPDSMWWVVVTMTTVGYGDMSPTTGVGRMLGVLCMFSGIILVSICIIIIGGNFEQAHHAFLIEKENHMKRTQKIQENNQIWRKDTIKILTTTESAPIQSVLNRFKLELKQPRSQSLKFNS